MYFPGERMTEEKERMIEDWKKSWLNEATKDKLIDLLVNPKRDLTKDIVKSLPASEQHHVNRMERSRKRREKRISDGIDQVNKGKVTHK